MALYCTDTHWDVGEIISVSRRGLFCRCVSLPSKDDGIELVLHAPEGEIRLLGRVSWTTDELYEQSHPRLVRLWDGGHLPKNL